MGFNYEYAGFNSAKEFVNAVIEGNEDDHLNIFVTFIKNNKHIPKENTLTMLQALKNKNWDEFANAYNGPDYKRNLYHIKMAENYKKFSDNPTEGLINSTQGPTERTEVGLPDNGGSTGDNLHNK